MYYDFPLTIFSKTILIRAPMEKVVYTPVLKEHLVHLNAAILELTREDTDKSVEQFLAELSFVQYLIDEIKNESNLF